MAKVVFVQKLWYEFPGIESLSAFLKKNGHNTDVVIADSLADRNIAFNGADIIAFSLMTGFQGWAVSLARKLKKKYNAFIIFGGPHPTYFPDVIYQDGVDAICRGEGEGALLELADRLDKKQPINDIQNLWVKANGTVYKNELRPLIEDLSALSFPDREIYYSKYSFLRKNTHRPFMAGRGCPYNCSFCFNENLKQMYKDKGRYVRIKSVASFIDEIKYVKSGYNTKKIFFHDDTFILDHKWLKEFLSEYKSEINLPFYCQGRADTLTEEIAKQLKLAGCQCVFFAVESGKEAIRRQVLNKNISNEQIRRSAAWLKESGIKVSTYNMLGIPGESIKDALETVELNIAIKTDYPRCSFLTPYPGTRIAEIAKEQGCLRQGEDFGITANSQQNEMLLTSLDKAQIKNLHSLFQTAIVLPWTYPLVKKLIKLPLGALYKAWWAVLYFFIFTKSEGRSLISMGLFALRSLKFNEKNKQ